MIKKNRGLDYTPLFRFLISKVGSKFNDVYSEAKSRLDKPDPIFYLVARSELEKKEVVRVSDDTYFSGLFVDNNGLLQFVNKDIVGTEKDIFSNSIDFGFSYTFNGKLYHLSN